MWTRSSIKSQDTRKAVSGILLTLLLTGIFTPAFNIHANTLETGTFEISVSNYPDRWFDPSLESCTIMITNKGTITCTEIILSIESIGREWQWENVLSSTNVQAIWDGKDGDGNFVNIGTYTYTAVAYGNGWSDTKSGTIRVSFIPPLPHLFYGEVYIEGSPAPDGTLVEARINGVKYEEEITEDGKYGYPNDHFYVPGDHPCTTEVEGGVNGDIIEFYVNGILANSYTFENGMITELLLNTVRARIARLITQEAIGGVPVTVDGQFYIILTLKSYIDPITLEVTPDVLTKVYVESAENYPVSDPEIARKIGVIDYVGQLQKDGFESQLYEKCESLREQLLVIGTIPLAEWPIEAIESIPFIIQISAQKLVEKLIEIAGEEVVGFLLNTKKEVRNQVEEDYGNAWNEYFQAWNIFLQNEEITDYDVADSFLEKYLSGMFYEDMGLFLCTKIYPGEVWEFFVREIFKVLTWGVSEECLAIVISNDYYLKYLTEKDKIQCQLSKKPYGFASYTLELAQVPPELTDEYNKCILRIEENTIQIYEAFANCLEGFSFEDYLSVIVDSPVELRVYDLQERITGLLDGEVMESIPNSWYYNNIVAIFFPSGSYHYEVAGRGEGTYDLTVNSVEDGETTSFTATEIPISDNAIHQYTVDWDALSQGEEGVTLLIDSDGDGVFEGIVRSDNELTYDEFLLQMVATTIDFDPDTLNLKSKGKWVTVYIELPEGYDVVNIDVSTVALYEGGNPIASAELHPTEIGDYDNDGIADLMVKFDRGYVTELISGGLDKVVLTVSGEVTDEVRFTGSDIIKVVNEGVEAEVDGTEEEGDLQRQELLV